MNDTNIRLSLTKFPEFTQPFWTWLTGIPLPNQCPPIRLGPWTYLTRTLFVFGAGIALSTYTVLNTPTAWSLLLIVSWMMTLNAARNMALVLGHQCGHYRFTGNPQVDRIVGECLTTLLFSQDTLSYRHDHTELHHGRHSFASERDPVLTFIRRFGYRGGMSKSKLWLLTLWTLFSPRFHGIYLRSRFTYNFFLTRGWRRIAAWLHLTIWAGLIFTVEDMWKAWVLAYAIPVFFFYHQSAFLELLTEHIWFVPSGAAESGREYVANRCWGRFCASPLPDAELPLVARALAWTKWWLLMGCYHFPVRLLVLAGDAPQHDFHHRHPGTMEWPTATYARQNDIKAGHPGWPAYQEVWGLHNAISRVFDGLEQMS